MLTWWKRRTYRKDVLADVMAMTLMLGDHEARVIKNHPGITNAIDLNFEKGTPPAVASVFIAASTMAYAIEQCVDIERRHAIEQQLSEWSTLEYQEQRANRASIVDGSLDQDMLLSRCQWMLMMAQDFLANGKIGVSEFRILKDAIYGPLMGESQEDLQMVRFDEALSNILGPWDSQE